MRIAAQRVSRASVTVDGSVISEIGQGLLVYLGCAQGDDENDARWLAEKAASLRIFSDEQGKMNRSVVDAGGGVLVVSAFTLQADARKGRRPSFDAAAPPEFAKPLCDAFVSALRGYGLLVQEGRFGVHMHVDSSNDGPICILLDSKRLF